MCGRVIISVEFFQTHPRLAIIVEIVNVRCIKLRGKLHKGIEIAHDQWVILQGTSGHGVNNISFAVGQDFLGGMSFGQVFLVDRFSTDATVSIDLAVEYWPVAGTCGHLDHSKLLYLARLYTITGLLNSL